MGSKRYKDAKKKKKIINISEALSVIPTFTSRLMCHLLLI